MSEELNRPLHPVQAAATATHQIKVHKAQTQTRIKTMAKQQQQQLVVLLMLVLVLASSPAASAASCNAGQLVACASAITAGAMPSAACCANLKAQQGCLCQFAKNPTYARYINSPNARKTVTSCGVSLPRC